MLPFLLFLFLRYSRIHIKGIIVICDISKFHYYHELISIQWNFELSMTVFISSATFILLRDHNAR
jgi:hypothetical protein